MLLKRIGRKMLAKIKPNPWRKRKIKRFGTLWHAVQHYCTNTTLHGLRYVVDPHLHAVERLYWAIIFIFCSFVASQIIYDISRSFREAPTSINIESTNYKISGVPFPSITLCPTDRVDWSKALDLEDRIFPNSTDRESIKTFRNVLAKMSMITFGDFDELTFLKDHRLDDLVGINLTDVLRQVQPRCEQLFSGCWWKNSNRNCCEIFELQKTEYGFCYSFNSEMSEARIALRNNKQDNVTSNMPQPRYVEERPRRASGYGDWSGIKVTIHLGNVTKPPDSREIDGVILVLTAPWVWPNSGTMIPAGSLTSVGVDCVSGFATQPVLQLDASKTPCRHESPVYNQETCLSRCKSAYVVKHCGCSPSFFFQRGRYRECSIGDFACLIEYNDVFNDYYVLADDDDAHGKNAMICDCPPECEYYSYDPRLSTVPMYRTRDISLDVHFTGQTGFRYKTDIVITDLNLLVSFGGIISLFLGGSLLSAAELIYYLMVLVFCYLRSCRQSRRKEVRVVSPIVLMRAAVPPLPILDYGPVKPRSRRIPILVNYASVNWNLNRY